MIGSASPHSGHMASTKGASTANGPAIAAAHHHRPGQSATCLDRLRMSVLRARWHLTTATLRTPDPFHAVG